MGTVLVLGGSGLLGSSLIAVLKASGYKCITAGRSAGNEVVLGENFTQTLKELAQTQVIDVVINLVALTNVDDCERMPFAAYQINAQFIASALAAIKSGSSSDDLKIIHISTDQVYSGTGPHQEYAAEPINVYGLTKYIAEEYVIACGGLVLRTNFFGKSLIDTRQSFSDWVVNALQRGESIPVFDDVLISALSINSLCEEIVLRIQCFKPGIFNLGTSQGYSKADLAFGLAQRLGLDGSLLQPTSVETVSLLARRPHDMRMDISLYSETFSTKLPCLQQELDKVVCEYEG